MPVEEYDSHDPGLPSLPEDVLRYQQEQLDQEEQQPELEPVGEFGENSTYGTAGEHTGNWPGGHQDDNATGSSSSTNQSPTHHDVDYNTTSGGSGFRARLKSIIPSSSKKLLLERRRERAGSANAAESEHEEQTSSSGPRRRQSMDVSPHTSTPEKLGHKLPPPLTIHTNNHHAHSRSRSDSSRSNANVYFDNTMLSPLSAPLHGTTRNVGDEEDEENNDEHERSSVLGRVLSRVQSQSATTTTRPASKHVRRQKSIWQLDRAGWEPDKKVNSYEFCQEYNNPLGCQVTVIDYCIDRYKTWRVEVHGEEDSRELEAILKARPPWSKVRWVNVSGQRIEALKTICAFYKLHKLAVEDMIDPGEKRTKAEQYSTHTFCCVPLFKCMDYKAPATPKRAVFTSWSKYNRKSFAEYRANERRSGGGAGYDTNATTTASHLRGEKDGTETAIHEVGPGTCAPPASRSQTRRGMPGSMSMTLGERIAQQNPWSIYKWNNPAGEKNVGSAYLESRRPLAAAGKALGIEQVYLFLTQDNTVISFFDKGGQRIESPVFDRIAVQNTILRESDDPSMLLQAIIDCIVDQIGDIIVEYRKKLDELEIAAILSPSMGHTQDLHLINAELTILRNSIVPITSVVNSLRDHRPVTENKVMSEEQESEAKLQDFKPPTISSFKHKSTSSQISELAMTYLSDVADHTMTYTQDLDVMRNNAKSMIELIFNTISIQSSDAVRLLSLVTVVFLPMSFLTGYYGMNFTDFDTLNNSVAYYWGIAVPFCVAMTMLLMWRWVRDKLRNFKNIALNTWEGYKSDRQAYKRYQEEKLEREKRATPDIV